MTTYSIASHGLADLALTNDLEDRLRNVLAEPGIGSLIEAEIEQRINAHLAVHGVTEEGEWLGDWSAAAIVEETLDGFSASMTDSEAVAMLVAEGFERADVDSVLNSLLDSNLVLDQPDDGHLLTKGEVDLLREQLLSDPIVVTTILADGAEQVVDREPITRADWEVMRGTTLSVGDTGGEPGQAYRVELVASGRVLDRYDTTTQ